MARRMRRSRGRSGKSGGRKTYWLGQSELFLEQPIDPGVVSPASALGEVATWWTIWPSDAQDPENNDIVTSADRTLVRTIISASVRTPQILPGFGINEPIQFCVGLIAWDSEDGFFFDQNIFPAGYVPDPIADKDADWIIRLPFTFPVYNLFAYNQAETFIVSRAMRKLPPKTGILACVSTLTFNDLATRSWNMSLDVRHAVRSGYVR